MAGAGGGSGGRGPRSADREAHRRGDPGHLDRICGSDLHLYKVLGMFIDPGDVLGHEPMGIVEEVGSEVDQIAKGDRVVVPFNISCGHCWMCEQQLFAQCETTQNRDTGTGASLFGYTKLYGQVPGGQAEYLRVPQAHFGPIKVPATGPRRPLPLPLRRPADRVAGGRVRRRSRRAARWPSSASGRSARWRRGSPSTRAPGVIGVDLVAERLELARSWGIETLDVSEEPGTRRRSPSACASSPTDAGRLGDRRRRHGGPRRAGRRVGAEGCRLLPDAVAKAMIRRPGSTG